MLMPGKKPRPITKDPGGRAGEIGSSGNRQSKHHRLRWLPEVGLLAMPQELMSSRDDGPRQRQCVPQRNY
jgi:hypothetical protein